MLHVDAECSSDIASDTATCKLFTVVNYNEQMHAVLPRLVSALQICLIVDGCIESRAHKQGRVDKLG